MGSPYEYDHNDVRQAGVVYILMGVLARSA